MFIKKTNQQFVEEVYNLVKDEYKFLQKYINSSTKIKVIHNKCGFRYMVTPDGFLRGNRCPKCSGRYKMTDEEFKQEVYDLVEDEYSVLADYSAHMNVAGS